MSARKGVSIKKIIHVDMDAFYASVEQRDFPAYRGKPLVVGGDPHSRGVVSTCSYEARAYGIHSAMPTKTAYRLCPHAIFVHPRMSLYAEVSKQIRNIFFQYTDLVEPLSFDEAYLDVTENKFDQPSATLLAKEIKRRITEETGLTGSAGVSTGKFFAKIASDMNKPDGLTVIRPEETVNFIISLPIRKFFGIGKKTEERLKVLGIERGSDLLGKSSDEMRRIFGKSGDFYFNVLRGIDIREVKPHRLRKSVGGERTFSKDIGQLSEMQKFLKKITQEVAERLRKVGVGGRTVTLKIKYADFKQITRSHSEVEYLKEEERIFDIANSLLIKENVEGKSVRLLGVSLANLDNQPEEKIKKNHQLDLLS